MNWNDYLTTYSNFLLSVQRTEIIFFHAGKAIPTTEIKNWEEDKVGIVKFINLARKGLAKFSGGYNSDRQLLSMESIVRLVFANQTEWILACQELTMLIAYLEVFIADTLAIIWQLDLKLLDSTPGGKDALKKRSVASASLLSQQQLVSVIEEATFNLMRKSPDGFIEYLKSIGLQIKIKQKDLYLANLNRNAIVHNGGLISHKYIHDLNPAERKRVVLGEPVPVNANYLYETYNLILSLGEQIFEEVSTKYFGVSQPLKDEDRTGGKQSPELKDNPLTDIARQAIVNIGGPDKAVAEPEKAKAELMRLLAERKIGN